MWYRDIRELERKLAGNLRILLTLDAQLVAKQTLVIGQSWHNVALKKIGTNCYMIVADKFFSPVPGQPDKSFSRSDRGRSHGSPDKSLLGTVVSGSIRAYLFISFNHEIRIK